MFAPDATEDMARRIAQAWPEAIPVLRHIVEGIAEQLAADVNWPLWSLLLELRAV
jgi:hypothetical protein